MELDEVAARVGRRYWALLLVLTVVPVLVVGYVMNGREPPAVAQTRIEASGSVTDAAVGDAGVSIVVSQVTAYATSRNLLTAVLKEQKIDRSPRELAKRIEVTGLGTATIVELSVEDADPETARKLADAIGGAVVGQINESNRGALNERIDEINDRVRDLEEKLAPLAREASGPVPDVGAMNERERVQAELTDLRSSRAELTSELTTAGSASVVQPAVIAPESDPMVMLAAIAGLVGLVLAILVAVTAEMLRPTVPGQRRVARRLGVPLLGRTDRGPEGLADLGRRTRLAARRAGVAQITLVGAPGPLPAELVSTVASAVYGDETKLVEARPDEPRPEDGGGDGPAVNSGGPGAKRTSTSVVRAGTAVMATKPGDVARRTPVPSREPCHVHAFEDVDPAAAAAAGVVVVVGPVTAVSGLETVRDLVAASGWPLLGVVGTRKIKR
ncbi:YveK family protein [Actinomadura sediminis]|uniref:Polysaccharide chain length determinant N-terminal domain-containing protein n=1 Tax=Actinomadura sediminis TaxID=1038904 RepID=A0ABW3ETF1_9ACTN